MAEQCKYHRLVIDLETTHLRPEMGNIIQVGIAELDPKNNVRIILDKYVIEEEINQKAWDNAWIFQNSEITPEMVLKKGKKWAEIAPEIQYILDHCRGVTAYNSAFDFGWLESRNITLPKSVIPCLMKTFAHGEKWCKFYEALDIVFPDTETAPEAVRDYRAGRCHTAGADATAEAALLGAMLRLGYY